MKIKTKFNIGDFVYPIGQRKKAPYEWIVDVDKYSPDAWRITEILVAGEGIFYRIMDQVYYPDTFHLESNLILAKRPEDDEAYHKALKECLKRNLKKAGEWDITLLSAI